MPHGGRSRVHRVGGVDLKAHVVRPRHAEGVGNAELLLHLSHLLHQAHLEPRGNLLVLLVLHLVLHHGVRVQARVHLPVGRVHVGHLLLLEDVGRGRRGEPGLGLLLLRVARGLWRVEGVLRSHGRHGALPLLTLVEPRLGAVAPARGVESLRLLRRRRGRGDLGRDGLGRVDRHRSEQRGGLVRRRRGGGHVDDGDGFDSRVCRGHELVSFRPLSRRRLGALLCRAQGRVRACVGEGRREAGVSFSLSSLLFSSLLGVGRGPREDFGAVGGLARRGRGRRERGPSLRWAVSDSGAKGRWVC